jgi:hypothetical protein
MGENPIGIDIGSRPSLEITLTNVALHCENCNQILPEGILSLRPRKEARFICFGCLELHATKIKDLKKSENGKSSNQGCSN